MPPRSMIFGACSAARPALGPSGCPPDCSARRLIRLRGGPGEVGGLAFPGELNAREKAKAGQKQGARETGRGGR